MRPAAQHNRPRGRQEALPHQERNHPRPEQFLQGVEVGSRDDMEQAVACEQAVGNHRVQVRVEIQVLAKGVDGHDYTGEAVGQVQGGLHVFQQARVGDVAEFLEQGAVETEVRAQHLGDAEGEVTVRDGEQDRLGDQRAEKLDLLLVAGGAEPAAFAGEGQQVFVLAMVAPDAGEAVFEVAAVHELVHDLGDDRAQKAVAGLETLFVGGKKGVEVPGQALPERRGAGFAGAVGLHLPGYMRLAP
jgi:hypothetical protein